MPMVGRSSRSLPRLRLVRVRTTSSAVVFVGAALLAAAIALVLIVQNALEDGVRTSARVRAGDFVALLESGTDPSELNIRLEEDVFVQIVDDSSAVVAASPTVSDVDAVADLDVGAIATV